MNSLKVSVIVTSYNGQKYIKEQLDSIFQQTKKADEVVICDDRSKDDTRDIIEKYIKERSLKNWKLYVNETNKGWRRNFIEALTLVTGDVIFFSDQDDIWFENKIDIMTGYMQKYPQIQCLSGKLVRIDSDGNKLSTKGRTVKDYGTGKLEKFKCDEKFNTLTLLGCTMCISKSLAEIMKKICVTDFGHDAQSCRLGILLDGTYLLDVPVIKYRMHNNNTSGVVIGARIGASDLEKRIGTIVDNVHWLEELLKYAEGADCLKERKDLIKKTIYVQRCRLRYLKNRKFSNYLKLFKYYKFYSGVIMFIGDIVYAHNFNGIVSKLLRD
jgi:Glycosyltransferases, probably involved in cell wall biogenesis